MTEIWPDHYGNDGRGDALSDMERRNRPRGLPFGAIAISPEDELVGTAALSDHSFGARPGEGPWLIGLCTRKDWRQQGVAAGLVATLEEQARTDGFREIFTTTSDAVGIFRSAGWDEIRTLDEGEKHWHILRQTL